MDLDLIRSEPSFPTAIFGSVGENAEWQVVYRAYLEDKLEAAYEGALQLGTGPGAAQVKTYRQIEAEAITRKSSEIRHVNDWLKVESVPEPTGELDAMILAMIGAAASRFAYSNRPPLMVTILIPEMDMPWAVGRAGYFVGKIPYNKICTPMASATTPRDLYPVLAHEYAHLIALDLAGGQAPRWLNEAFATLSENHEIATALAGFVSGQFPWRAEHELEAAFSASSNDHHGIAVLHQAYAQAGVIGRYLQSLKGDTGFADLLKGFSNNSRWQDIKMRITGQEPVDEALREVFGIGVNDLFTQAEAWVHAQ